MTYLDYIIQRYLENGGNLFMFDLLRRVKFRWLLVGLVELLIIAAYVVTRKLFSADIPFLASEALSYIVVGAIFFITLIATIFSIHSFEKSARQNYVTITNTLGADISEAYSFGEIGLLMYNDKKEVIWSSNLFTERGIKVMGQVVDERFPNLKPLFANMNKEENEPVEEIINQRQYSVMNLSELNVLIFKDISEVTGLYKLREEEAPVFVMIQLDNLYDVVNISADDEFVQMEALIRKAIADWGRENAIVIKKIKDDTYFGVLSEQSYQVIKDGEFKILTDVNKFGGYKDVTFTVSLGFGRGVQNFSKLSELASSAIDVAQSRGGDQVVVNNFGGKMEFYGGLGSEAKIRRNPVRNKVLAQSFFSHIQTFSTIFILVHKQADFDAIGAALGVISIAQAANRPAYIVYEDKQIETKAKSMLKEMFTKSELEAISITPSKAVERINDECLVVVVDVNRPILTTAERLLEKAQNVAVIDHHRRAEDAIDSPIFSHIDTAASSASELIVEMIMNITENVKITPKVATYMLAGILLDTGGFKARTTEATFRAAMHLKEFGADNTIADSYLKDEFEEFTLKTKIMSNVESPYFGIVIATAPTNQIVDRTLLARVGDELVSVKGVRAAFVVGYISDRVVGLSARSDGNVNIQFIMEKMGGGGHHSAAAAQVSNEKLENVNAQLKKILSLYINEITGKEESYGSNTTSRR